MANQRPEHIGDSSGKSTEKLSVDIANLDAYFKLLAKDIKDRTVAEQRALDTIAGYKRKLEDKLQKDRHRREEEHLEALTEMEVAFDEKKIKDIAKLKERFEKIQSDKNKADDLKRLTDYYKANSKKAEKEAKDKKAAAERELETQKELKEWDENGGSIIDGAKLVKNQLVRGLQNVFSGSGLSKLGTEKLAKAMEDLTAGINSAMEKYADYRSKIDTRLQGSYYSFGDSGASISSFDKLVNNLGVVSNSGLLSTEELYENLSELVSAGVVTNIEQKAFLQSIKDTVATTFDVNTKALNRIIRLQQDDSVAMRLGLESYLTRFLNEFVESTEYLTDTFDTVADSLLEASSLMSKNQSVEFEYIVQKWLGTLVGLGLSDSTSTSIASAIGQLASGNISSLSSSEMQNLIVMAASKSGLSYADLLTNGMDANSTNDLLLGIVEYMQELGSYSSNVVKSELAKTFGVTVSDIVAAQNMTNDDLETAYKSMMSANDMNNELAYQLGQTGNRLGISKILSNLYKNTEYSTGMSIASNPVLYSLWKITDFISSATSEQGVAIPSFSIFGNQIDLETTVDALLKGGVAGIGMLSNIGGIIGGLASTASGSGYQLYNLLGGAKVSRQSGVTTSAASYTGNYAGGDYADSAVNAATDSGNETLNQKKEEEKTEDEVVTYLKDLEFSDKFTQITDDIHSLKVDGVAVKSMPVFADLSGWTLGAHS